MEIITRAESDYFPVTFQIKAKGKKGKLKKVEGKLLVRIDLNGMTKKVKSTEQH